MLLRVTYYSAPILRPVGLMDIAQLHRDIHSTQQTDKECSAHKSNPNPNPNSDSIPNPCWSTGEEGLLRYDDCIWVPDSDNLRLHVLLNKHDHPRVTMDKTRHWILSAKIICGLVSEPSSRI